MFPNNLYKQGMEIGMTFVPAKFSSIHTLDSVLFGTVIPASLDNNYHNEPLRVHNPKDIREKGPLRTKR